LPGEWALRRPREGVESMIKKQCYWLAPLLALFVGLPLRAAETINLTDINKIKAEGMQHSQVMELNSWLSDVYGPRLTGSPAVEQGAKWAMGKMKEWGLVNVKMEPWTNRNGFERGWTNDKFYVQAISPQKFAIPGTPTAWTPGTKGLVSGEVVMVTANNDADLAKYKGKLRGKWVITAPAPDVEPFWTAPATRYSSEELAALEKVTTPGRGRVLGSGPETAPPPAGGPPTPAAKAPTAKVPAAPPAGTPQPRRPFRQGAPGTPGRGQQFANTRNEFFAAEGALGVISTSSRGHGLYTIGGDRATDPEKSAPRIMIAAEQYGRIARIIGKNQPVVVEADIKNSYYPNPPMFNIVGEIPGTDKADEVVMLGAHFDSWHAATGAADNGVGSCAMLEVMRILKATGVRLRRTVRIGLWTGEEQGIIGSREYVAAHYGSRKPIPGAAASGGGAGGRRFGGPQGPLELKPEHAKFDVYLNLDNGSGALRGVYLQGNTAVAPIFREWMEPFRSMGVTTLTVRNTRGTDHQSFDAVGLPAFQFIQDEIEYEVVSHHTNMDTYERLQPNDCMKMATIVAGFAYLAANRDELLPRKPLPTAGQRGS
jgi:carboxypeptidase Q